jgi:hypothetical protein
MTFTMKQTPIILHDPLKFSLDFKMGMSFRTLVISLLTLECMQSGIKLQTSMQFGLLITYLW